MQYASRYCHYFMHAYKPVFSNCLVTEIAWSAWIAVRNSCHGMTALVVCCCCVTLWKFSVLDTVCQSDFGSWTLLGTNWPSNHGIGKKERTAIRGNAILHLWWQSLCVGVVCSFRWGSNKVCSMNSICMQIVDAIAGDGYPLDAILLPVSIR